MQSKLQIWSNYKGDVKDDLPIITENSSPDILFECHPFLQCCERTSEFYGIPKRKEFFNSKNKAEDTLYVFTNLDKFPEAANFDFEYCCDIPWIDTKRVVIGSIRKTFDTVYLVIDSHSFHNTKMKPVPGTKCDIVSMLIDKSSNLQIGDGYTTAWLCDSSLVIKNSGDVSSIVVIQLIENPLVRKKLASSEALCNEAMITVYNELLETLDKLQNKVKTREESIEATEMGIEKLKNELMHMREKHCDPDYWPEEGEEPEELGNEDEDK